jgi:hypothetical protein
MCDVTQFGIETVGKVYIKVEMKGLAAMSGVLGGLGISPTSIAKNGVGIFRVSGERAHGRPACPVCTEYHIFCNDRDY